MELIERIIRTHCLFDVSKKDNCFNIGQIISNRTTLIEGRKKLINSK